MSGRVVAVILLATSVSSPGHAATSPMSWENAISALQIEGGVATRCVALLKRYGTPSEVAQGSLAYERARGIHEAAIAGLLIAIGEGSSPGSVTDLDDDIAISREKLEDFCAEVNRYLPSHEGKKDLVIELGKAVVGPALAGLTGAVSALWQYFLTRRGDANDALKQGLESARWPDFAAIPADP